MNGPEWWDAFVAEYESRWGDMPKASDEKNQPAFLDVWFRELQGMRPVLVVSLCQRVQAEMSETRTRGKPHLAQFAGQLRILLQPWTTTRRTANQVEAEAFETRRRPLFRFTPSGVERLREPFLCELPLVVQRECWDLVDRSKRDLDRETVGQAIGILFQATWDDYAAQEQAAIRAGGGRVSGPAIMKEAKP